MPTRRRVGRASAHKNAAQPSAPPPSCCALKPGELMCPSSKQLPDVLGLVNDGRELVCRCASWTRTGWSAPRSPAG